MKKLLLLFIIGFLSSPLLRAETGAPSVYIKVGEARTKKSVLALPPFQFQGNGMTNPQFQKIGQELFRVVQIFGGHKLLQTRRTVGLFGRPNSKGLRPAPQDPNGFRFESWRTIGAEFLIRAGFNMTGEGISLETYVYHVPKGELIMGKRYRGNSATVRRIAHTFCNDLMEALSGQKGFFLSRVAVSSDRSGGKGKEIFVMDWDGANINQITNHRSVSLSPTWSPDGTKVAYTAFVMRARTRTRNADLFLYELLTGKRWLVSYRAGMNSGATFTPDGQNLLLTLSQNATPDIYKISTEGEMVKRLTNGPLGALNVEPAVSPDGKKIAFSSDRAGNPMIYVMNIDGTQPQRLTFAGKFNATPSWSPDGKKLAFSGWQDDHFDIFVMDADGSNMVRITQARKPNGKAARNEDPVFSPDGRLLMYTSDRTGTNQIYISNLDGSEERRVTSDNFNYYKPKWSINIE